MIFATLKAGELIVDVSLADDGENAVGSEVTSTKDDALRSVDCRDELEELSCASESCIVTVRTIGGAILGAIDNDLITTSPPSNVRAESRALSSVSALTASELTISGNRTPKRS